MKTRGAAPAEGSGEPPPMVAHGVTHAGKRPKNEDCHLVREDLGFVVVADGFAGTPGGDIAARIAVEEIADCFAVQDTLPSFEPHELAGGLTVATVRFAIERAYSRVRFEAQRSGRSGMSAAAAVLVVAGPRVVVGHVGNIRVHRFRADALEQLTSDSADGRRIGGPAGADGRAQPVIRTDAWRPGDRYLLVTTGLHRALGPEAIRCTLATHASLTDCATALVGRALHAGAADNLTAVLVAPRPRGVAMGTAAAEQRGA